MPLSPKGTFQRRLVSVTSYLSGYPLDSSVVYLMILAIFKDYLMILSIFVYKTDNYSVGISACG